MKKLCAFVLMLSFMPGLIIFATPPQPTQDIFIYLTRNDGYFIDDQTLGHLDVLVLKEDVEDRILDSISPIFIEKYGDPSLYDYLTLENDYISYSAFVLDASFAHEEVFAYRFFTRYEHEYKAYTSFKLIYIDENQEVKSTSSVIEIGKVNDNQMIDGYIEFNIDTGEWINHIEIITRPNWGRFFIFVALYALLVIVIRTYLYYIISISIILIIVVILRIYFKKRL
jgi:hypothetical protein